tara:strand:- start:3643 stop:4632 length:990 start_codon:yes stop_codon:yes gene_type:complete
MIFDKFKNTKVLITGGLGFIGSNLAKELVNLGADVTIIDSLIPDMGGNLFNISEIKDKVQLFIKDLRDFDVISKLVKDKDYIFNLAGHLSHVVSMSHPILDMELNCKSQLFLLEACRKFNPSVKIIFTGTRAQYGRPLYLPVDEKHPLNSTDINGINKTAAESYHLLYSKTYGIHISSLRLTNTYGPGHLMNHNKQGFMGWFIRKAIDNEEITIYGDGKQIRDFNYVDDVVNALLMTIGHKNSNCEIFNLGCNERISVYDFADNVIKLSNSGKLEIIPFPKEKKKIEVGDFYNDISKIKEKIGWEPKINLKQGLTKTLDYYKKYKDMYW